MRGRRRQKRQQWRRRCRSTALQMKTVARLRGTGERGNGSRRRGSSPRRRSCARRRQGWPETAGIDDELKSGPRGKTSMATRRQHPSTRGSVRRSRTSRRRFWWRRFVCGGSERRQWRGGGEARVSAPARKQRGKGVAGEGED